MRSDDSRRAEMPGISTLPPADTDIVCCALQLALVATQLRRAWHAGVMDAETAMRTFDFAARKICDHCGNDPGSVETGSRSPVGEGSAGPRAAVNSKLTFTTALHSRRFANRRERRTG